MALVGYGAKGGGGCTRGEREHSSVALSAVSLLSFLNPTIMAL